MVRMYLDGQITRLDISLDFPYEIEKRYKKMLLEDSRYTELIYTRLLEDGIESAEHLSDDEFREHINRQYEDVDDIAKGGFL